MTVEELIYVVRGYAERALEQVTAAETRAVAEGTSRRSAEQRKALDDHRVAADAARELERFSFDTPVRFADGLDPETVATTAIRAAMEDGVVAVYVAAE